MRALVVHESMFGCTRTIAEAIASGLADEGAEVSCLDVRDAPTNPDVDLLIVAAPTHAFGLSRKGTRESANQQGAHWKGDGVREWIDQLTEVRYFATVDTKISIPRVPGSAGGAAQRALKMRGGTPIAKHESFWVHATKGPLFDGEAERARFWGRTLAVASKVAA